MLLQTCIGLDVEALASTVHFRNARLPLFLDHLQLENVAIGESRVDLRLHRQRNGVGVDVLERRGAVAVVNVK